MDFYQAKNLLDELQQQLTASYPLLAGWQLGFDRAKRRAGSCRLLERRITVSTHHISHNSWPVVKDTFLHECAHAIAFLKYQETGHGRAWKQVAMALGATPRARGYFDTGDKPWVLVHYCSHGQKLYRIAERFRRNKNLRHYYLHNRPETRGQLYYVSQQQMRLYQSGEINLAEVKLHQQLD